MPKIGLGIDFGCDSIKIAKVKLKNNSYVVADFQIIPLSHGIADNNIIKQKNLLLQALTPVIKKNKLKGLRCVTAVSIPEALVKLIKLPVMERDELNEAVKWEVEKYLPFPAEQAVTDYKIINRDQENSVQSLNILLICIQREIVEEHVELIKQLGLKHTAIDLTAFAYYRALAKSLDDTDTQLLLDFGAGALRLFFYREGLLCFQRSIAFGGNRLTQSLMNSNSYTWQEAEEIKKKYGIYAVGNSINETEINPAFLSSLNFLIQEVQKSIGFFNLQYDNQTVKRIVITGGGAGMKGISDLLTAELSLPVSIYNLSEQVELGQNENCEELHNKLPLAIGLALRGAKGWK